MKKSARKRWLVAIIAAALLVLVCWLLLQVDNAPAEDVQIRAWCMQVLQSNPNGRAMILEAGTNAVPSLARLTRTRDPLARKAFWAFARKLPGSQRRSLAEHVAPPGAEAVREAACISLGLL